MRVPALLSTCPGRVFPLLTALLCAANVSLLCFQPLPCASNACFRCAPPLLCAPSACFHGGMHIYAPQARVSSSSCTSMQLAGVLPLVSTTSMRPKRVFPPLQPLSSAPSARCLRSAHFHAPRARALSGFKHWYVPQARVFSAFNHFQAPRVCVSSGLPLLCALNARSHCFQPLSCACLLCWPHLQALRTRVSSALPHQHNDLP